MMYWSDEDDEESEEEIYDFDDGLEGLLSYEESDYDSDEFFIDSDSEEMKELVAKSEKMMENPNHTDNEVTQDSDGKFEYWEFLPSELQEMILDYLDFETWINLKLCSGENKKNLCFPNYPVGIARFSFYSDIIQEGSKEMEHIRIRVYDRYRSLMVKIKECEGYCRISWNLENKTIGSIDIPNCSYLKVAQRFMKSFIGWPCKSFKLVANKDKTDSSAQSVSKWPYFHKFVVTSLAVKNYDQPFIDEEVIIFVITFKTRTPVIEAKKTLMNLDAMPRKKMEMVLGFPSLDAKKIVDSIIEQLPEDLEDRKRNELAKKDLCFAYESYTVSQVDEKTIKINGTMPDYERYEDVFDD